MMSNKKVDLLWNFYEALLTVVFFGIPQWNLLEFGMSLGNHRYMRSYPKEFKEALKYAFDDSHGSSALYVRWAIGAFVPGLIALAEAALGGVHLTDYIALLMVSAFLFLVADFLRLMNAIYLGRGVFKDSREMALQEAKKKLRQEAREAEWIEALVLREEWLSQPRPEFLATPPMEYFLSLVKQ